MEPDHLEDDEIAHEFSLRSMPPVITRHRLQSLRDRLLMELRGEVERPNKNLNPDSAGEVNLCSDKLNILDGLVLVASDTNCVDSMKKVLSRLNHISGRLDRTVSDDYRILDRINSLKNRIFYYVNLLSAAVQGKLILKDHLNTGDGLGLGAIGGSSASGSGESRPLTPIQKNTGAIPKAKALTPVLNVITEEYVPLGRKSSSVQSGLDGGLDLSAHMQSFNISDEQQLDKELMAISNSWKFVPLPDKNNDIRPPSNYSNVYKQTPKSMAGRLYEPHNFFGDQVGSRVVENNTNEFVSKEQVNRPSILRRPSQPNKTLFRDRVSEVPPIYQDYKQNLNRTNARPQSNMHDYRNINQAGHTPHRNHPGSEINVPVVGGIHRNENTVRYRNPISSWNLVFSGDGKGVNVNQFLRQVELTARADRVSTDDLLESAIHLFVGPARNWYIAFEYLFNTWDELTINLRQNFVSEDSDFILLKEIESRVQGKEESFILYLSGMLNLFHHLKEPLSERKKLDMVMRNMNPFLADRVALLEIDNTQQLAMLCKKIEDVRTRSKSFRQSHVESYSNYSKRYVSEVERDPSPIPVQTQVEVKCVNCRELGHSFVNCKRPKMRVFCYICGELGQLANNCDSCLLKSKNASTRSKRNAWDGIEM